MAALIACMQRLNSCRAVHATHCRSHADLSTSVNNSNFMFPRFLPPRKTEMSFCKDLNVRRVRIGPIHSSGQISHNVETPEVHHLFNESELVIAYSGQPSQRGSEAPIGYPPLYVHHIHVVRIRPRFVDRHWFTTHGDFASGNTFGNTLVIPW